MSVGRWMQEYDLGYVTTSGVSADRSLASSRSAASYRLAAFSMALNQGARAYAGNFPAASGNLGQSVGNFFFTHPIIVGVAYNSRGNALSDYGLRASVRLVLPMRSQVRISAAGRELFNGMLGAGDQTIEFSGYQDAFVDVFIRDAAGLTRTQVAEVIRKPGVPVEPVAGSGFWGDLYFDAGNLLDTGNTGAGIHISGTQQVGANYSHPIRDYLLVGGYQTIGERRRFAVSVAPIDRSWQINYMRGNQQESGYNFSGPLLRWEKFDILLNQTLYRTPLNIVQVDGKAVYFQNEKLCLANLTPICHRPVSFDSVGLTFGYQGFPLHVGYIENHTSIERTSAATVSGIYAFRLLGIPISASGFVARDLQKKSHSIFVSLSFPLDDGSSLNSSLASTGALQRTASQSFTRQADEGADDRIRTLDLTTAVSRDPTREFASTSAYLESRMGSIKNITDLAIAGQGNRSIGSIFSMSHDRPALLATADSSLPSAGDPSGWKPSGCTATQDAE